MIMVAILDDYANAALLSGDWSAALNEAEMTIFDRPLGREEIVSALKPFDIICLIRERTTIDEAILDQLPNLKAIILSDSYIRTIDKAAAADRGIAVVSAEPMDNRQISPHDTAEFVWGLVLALVRHIPAEVEALRNGRWQSTLGSSLAGKTLGIAGLGRTGARVAHFARAFDMKILAWSQNLTAETAAANGAELVDKDRLFAESDIVTVHYALSDRSHGIVGAREIGLMKPTAYFINTSRGPIIDEQALIVALQEKRIAGAALDVFNQEPLPHDSPLLKLDNVIATPHLGFVTDGTMHYYHASIAAGLTHYLASQSR